MSAAVSMGTPGSTLMAWRSLTTVCSVNTDVLANCHAGSPSRVNGRPSLPMLLGHMVGCPDSQAGHRPQFASVDRTTRSPGSRLVTDEPTSSYQPGHSWP